MMKEAKIELAQLVESLKAKNNREDEEMSLCQVQKHITSESWIDIKINQFPKRYRELTFSDFEHVGTEEQINKQLALIKHLRECSPVLMYGNNGTGKTMLAYASMKDKIEKGMNTLYTSLFDLMSEIKESFSSYVSTSRIIEKFTDCDYLVIDEIDKSYRTVTEFNYFFSIMDKRYYHEKPTVLISNAGESDIIDVIGKSVFERIVEDGVAVHMNWDSYRKRIPRKQEIYA
jgi:DNA replication protein DnaC